LKNGLNKSHFLCQRRSSSLVIGLGEIRIKMTITKSIIKEAIEEFFSTKSLFLSTMNYQGYKEAPQIAPLPRHYYAGFLL
jgi:hypothetical protein